LNQGAEIQPKVRDHNLGVNLAGIWCEFGVNLPRVALSRFSQYPCGEILWRNRGKIFGDAIQLVTTSPKISFLLNISLDTQINICLGSCSIAA